MTKDCIIWDSLTQTISSVTDRQKTQVQSQAIEGKNPWQPVNVSNAEMGDLTWAREFPIFRDEKRGTGCVFLFCSTTTILNAVPFPEL